MLLYLAGPYTHQLASVRENRYHAHREATGTLMREGWSVFSPITQGHNVDDLVKWDGRQWLDFDLPILKKADILGVLTLPGWRNSFGTEEEIQFSQQNRIKIIKLDPNHYVSALTLVTLNGIVKTEAMEKAFKHRNDQKGLDWMKERGLITDPVADR